MTSKDFIDFLISGATKKKLTQDEKECLLGLKQVKQDLESFEVLKSILEVTEQYKYTTQNTYQIKIKQDLVYDNNFALLIKNILENKGDKK